MKKWKVFMWQKRQKWKIKVLLKTIDTSEMFSKELSTVSQIILKLLRLKKKVLCRCYPLLFQHSDKMTCLRGKTANYNTKEVPEVQMITAMGASKKLESSIQLKFLKSKRFWVNQLPWNLICDKLRRKKISKILFYI